jgi:hypothetical protein
LKCKAILLYLFWAILNVGLFFGFVYLLIRAVGFIKEEFGLFQCVVFVFGLLSTCNSTEEYKKMNEPLKFEIGDIRKLTPANSINTTVEKNTLFNIELSILVGATINKKEAINYFLSLFPLLL